MSMLYGHWSTSMPDRREPAFPAAVSELDPVEVPITGELNLHTFHPGEIGSLLPECFAECQSTCILKVRVVYGKR